MKVKYISNILFIIFLLPFISLAQTDQPCHYSTEGTDFWFGIMQNRNTGTVHYMEITVSSRIGAQLTITYGPGETLISNQVVNANSSLTLKIDYQLLEPTGSETIENKGIHVVATNPVNVYALNYRTQSSDVAVIYPTESLGLEYFAMCYTPHTNGTTQTNSEFLIVANEDNTTVKITPSVDTDGGKSANATFSVQLNKGQSYQVQSMNSNVPGQGDLTGSSISSDKKIAFFSGSKATSVPLAGNSYDFLYEQIPPISTWGREFYVVPLSLKTKDTYRVLAAEDGTTVTIEELNRTITLNRGKYYEFELTNIQATRIITNKRVLLAQYCRSQAADGGSGVGDPFMIIICPVTQKINDVTFVAYESEKIQSIFYVNIITLKSEINTIKLDGNTISTYFKSFSDLKYSYAQVPITKGSHRLQNSDKEGGFVAFIYGFGNNGDTESYGYGVGFNLDIQLDIGGILSKDTLFVCKGTEQLLDAGTYFNSYKWNTGETSSSIKVYSEGVYWVNAKTLGGCDLSDTVYVKVVDPKINLGKDTGSCIAGEIVLDAGKDFVSYLWQDGSTNRTFQVDNTGNYSVSAIDKGGCPAADTIHVIIFSSEFSQDYDVATDQHPDIAFTNHTEAANSYLWNFGDGETSVEENPVHHYSKIGEYKVILEATSNFGCSDTISSIVRIVPFNLHTPNAFRPDSQIPENRIFLPITEGTDPENYQFRIFNRVGSTVFESQNPETGWDGKMSNGTDAGPGIYVWIVKFLDLQGYEHLQKGTVMLVR